MNMSDRSIIKHLFLEEKKNSKNKKLSPGLTA